MVCAKSIEQFEYKIILPINIMLNKRFSLISLILISAVSSLLSVFVFAEKSKDKIIVDNSPKIVQVDSTNSCELNHIVW